MADFYMAQSATSDPKQYSYLLDKLPTDFAGIAQVVQGLIYHYMAGPYLYGWTPPQDRFPEINTRTVERILAALLAKDARPLTESRPFVDRLIGCCRDFSLLTCAILRHQGRAARLRYGFGNYFVPDYWFDHVIVELWEDGRWRRFDPQLSLDHDWGFNPLDMPADVFVTGGCAWQLCRAETADPARFGLGPNELEVRGWWFIRERLQLDVAALNKIELLCWDGIAGLTETQPADVALLDEMAMLSLDSDTTALRLRCATDPRWQMPTTVTCFHPMIGPAFAVAVG